MDNFNALVVALESEVFNAKRSITNSNCKLVDEQRIMNIINTMKTSLPQTIVEAGYIMADREKIINSANMQAQEIMHKAQTNASQMVNESDIIRAAQDNANRIVAEARQYADFLKNETAGELIRMLTYGESAFANVLAATRDYIEQVNRGNLDFTRDEPQN